MACFSTIELVVFVVKRRSCFIASSLNNQDHKSCAVVWFREDMTGPPFPLGIQRCFSLFLLLFLGHVRKRLLTLVSLFKKVECLPCAMIIVDHLLLSVSVSSHSKKKKCKKIV